MKKLIILALLALTVPVAAQAWMCFAEAPNGAAGTGMSPLLWQAQENAVFYCQMEGGGAFCQVLSCR